MKKKYLLIGLLVMALAVLAVWAVPVFADGATNSSQPAQVTQQVGKITILIRLLTVQDEAKVDAFLAKAVSNNKITQEQATNIKTMWTNHHAQFKPGSPLVRVLKAKNEAKVKAALDKAVANEKITADQEAMIITLWENLHKK